MEGHVINQKLYNKSGCPNLGNFQESDKKTIKLELENLAKKSIVQLKDLNNKANNLLEYFIGRYGKKATELIYKPIYEKFTELKIEDLSISNKDHFVSSRFIAFNRGKSKKKSVFWDWRIAFSDCTDGESNINKFYPKNGGIYKWIEDIRENLLNKVIKIKCLSSINYFQRKKLNFPHYIVKIKSIIYNFFYGKVFSKNCLEFSPIVRHNS